MAKENLEEKGSDSLSEFERTIEWRTGKSIEYIRNTPIEQMINEARANGEFKPTYAPPEIGLRCGHEIRMPIISHEEANKMLDKTLFRLRVDSIYQMIGQKIYNIHKKISNYFKRK